ncbi:MAG: hypothetical protein K8R77_13755, partial [Anaerolineaceae bacterium]|nr:hypothetical protein [Anaerolineaceae bacterium]
AGILNTLFHVEQIFGTPIIAVIGGMHLISADDQNLEHVVGTFAVHFQNISFYPNHCTSENAFRKLKNAFGSQVNACPAGTTIQFQD